MENGILAHSWTEKFTRREAWLWMIENAAWEDHRVRFKNIVIRRGDLPTTIRDLMAKFRWSQGKVTRFLNELVSDAMITKQTDTGFCIITICNYDKFQNPYGENGTNKDTAAGDAVVGETDTSNKNIKNSKKENNTPLSPRKRGATDPALLENLPVQFKEPCRFESEFWPLYPKKKNKVKAKEAYDEARKKDTQSNIIAGVRAYRREWENDPRTDDEKNRFIKWPQGWLNEERWRDYTESTEPDDEKMPAGMTPAEHAAWNLRRIGHT